MFWRSVLFGFHTYQPALISRIKTQPLGALLQLIPLVLKDAWKTSAGAWARAFTLPTVQDIGARHLQRYWLFTTVGILASTLYLLFYAQTVRRGRNSPMASSRGCRATSGSPRRFLNKQPGGHEGRTLQNNDPTVRRGLQDRPDELSAPPAGGDKPTPLRTLVQTWPVDQRWVWQPVGIGLLALFIAGGPFWLTDLQIGLVFPNDRFTIPFMLGASLLMAGLLVFLPLPRWSKSGLLGIALGLAIGLQYQNAVSYSTDWSLQRSMFWQMVWRMPDLQPGTVLLSNELPLTHYTDNSLTAPLNWIYDPQNDPSVMKYALLYPTLREDRLLSSFKAGQPIVLDYLATTFRGSTSQMVAFYYNPPGCLRVLDPQVDVYNWLVPIYMREPLNQVTTDPILPETQAGKPAPRPPANIFGAEISHGWCYYFEKADLARQVGDWQTVASLGDEAFANSDYPNDPLERFPFIEGYAHAGRWESAISLTHDSHAFSPQVMQPMLCQLWQRIGQKTPSAPEKQNALKSVQAELKCSQALK
jgi:hypothetical protein